MGLIPDEDRIRRYFTAFTSEEVGGTKGGGVSRPAASDYDAAARNRLTEFMEELGLESRFDDVGNMYGRYATSENADNPPVLIGSHLDTVMPGGKFDGILGVILALEAVAMVKDSGIHGSKPIEVVNFTGEEGARFAPAMLGSGVVSGIYDIEYACSRTDSSGKTLGDELERIGYAGDVNNRLGGFSSSLEAHIEQDSELDANGLSVGVVDGIRPVTWSTITVLGKGGHAGGPDQDERADPVIAAARMIVHIDDAVRAVEGAKATIGQMDLQPGSANVIPSQVTFNLDLRASSDDAVQTLLAAASHEFAAIAADSGVEYAVDTYWTMPQVNFDSEIRTTIKRTANELGIGTMTITGEIGHDSLHLGQVGRSAMMFVRNTDGLSHAEEEHVPWAAVVDAAAVYANTVAKLIK